MTIYTKTCVLCPTKIPPYNKLCELCYDYYAHYVHTDWFIELENMQKRQDDLDRKQLQLFDYTNISEKNEHVHFKRNIGRPLTNWKLEQQVLDLFDHAREEGKRISLRKISSLLQNKVKYLTVRRILLEYRSDYFPYNKSLKNVD